MTWALAKLLGFTLVLHLIVKTGPKYVRVWLSILLLGLAIPFFMIPVLNSDFAVGRLVLAQFALKRGISARALALLRANWQEGRYTPTTASLYLGLLEGSDSGNELWRVASEALRLYPDELSLRLIIARFQLNAGRNEQAYDLVRPVIDSSDMKMMMTGYDIMLRVLIRRGNATAALDLMREEQSRLPSPDARNLLERTVRKTLSLSHHDQEAP
ncbi:MAG: hypothetical protein HQM09_20155 [Candidatus Riflebacteria bacterium]|nr:hypothetical protein [Candidatus Riflebacteria bacterium]